MKNLIIQFLLLLEAICARKGNTLLRGGKTQLLLPSNIRVLTGREGEGQMITKKKNRANELHVERSKILNVIPAPSISVQEVKGLFNNWNYALLTHNPDFVAGLYSKEAILLSLTSEIPITKHKLIKDYYISFLKDKPHCEILKSNIVIGSGWALDTGVYQFTFGATGEKLQARYSFLYRFEGTWKIYHHHSSLVPQKLPIIEDITDQDVKALFTLWNDALATLNPDKVLKRYAKNAVLLPTLSDIPRTTPDLIKEYFIEFLKKKPQGLILESYVTRGLNWAEDVGIYEFTMGTTGTKVKARYTFVYVLEDTEWKISHHHSSLMPEELLAAADSKTSVPQISVKEIRSLFNLWDAAIATLNPDMVMARYTKDAILLPTLSDTPRSTPEMIREYFEHFLLNKPRGKIIQSKVLKGDDWALDAGIYQFTFGTTGEVLKARYSFLYTFQDGEWKISHHHSSFMPESIPHVEHITEAKVKDLFTLWNNAIATFDADTVVKRYATNATVFSSASVLPLTSHDMIKSYFLDFLQMKPYIVQLKSFVYIGLNWAEDVGTYEYTIKETGEKVVSSYSFVYIFEDNEWKILHQHS
jgi:uncharacterized protein (TIGR02246 family)